jgi:cobalt/nickel transport system ATP-binding protein
MIMPLIEMNDVHFNYPDGTRALDGINFSIPKGEFVGILGANGSGKTTLLKLLNRLLKPTRGDVFLDGKNYKSFDKDSLFTRVCTVFQNPDDQLFSPTVSQDVAFGPENMSLSKEDVRARVSDALAAVEMSGCAEKAIQTLSYGQKKRVCIAGVLAMGPEVILLDEPTASLDPMGVYTIMHLLKRLNTEGKTMVMATHSVDLAPLFFDTVIVMSGGKIVRQGTPRDVFSDTKIIRESRLRLPRIGHLSEILKKDGIPINGLPLTIGEARKELRKLYEER